MPEASAQLRAHDEALEDVLRRCEAELLSPPLAIMELLIATEDAEAVAELLRCQQHRSAAVAELARVFTENEAGCSRIAAMLAADVDRPPVNATVEEGVAFCRNLFDWSVKQSEEASVALYSLGNPALLQAATAEIAGTLDSWGMLTASCRALDIGCGTGRMELALSSRISRIHGIDVSSEMVATAQKRCAHLGNVTFATCSGLGLEGVGERPFDLVLSVDSFPYVVQSGWALVDRFFADVSGSLAPGGHFVILNFSYRQDEAADRQDALRLADAFDFELLANGAMPFRLWNAAAFSFRKPHSTSGCR